MNTHIYESEDNNELPIRVDTVHKRETDVPAIEDGWAEKTAIASISQLATSSRGRDVLVHIRTFLTEPASWSLDDNNRKAIQTILYLALRYPSVRNILDDITP